MFFHCVNFLCLCFLFFPSFCSFQDYLVVNFHSFPTPGVTKPATIDFNVAWGEYVIFWREYIVDVKRNIHEFYSGFGSRLVYLAGSRCFFREDPMQLCCSIIVLCCLFWFRKALLWLSETSLRPSTTLETSAFGFPAKTSLNLIHWNTYHCHSLILFFPVWELPLNCRVLLHYTDSERPI